MSRRPWTREGTISVGSRLVELEGANSPLLGPVLTSIFGASSALTLAGYDGLLTADVPLGVLGDAAGDLGTTDSVVDDLDVNVRQLASVAASGLGADDAAVAADATTALGELAASIDPALEFDVEDVLDATTEDPQALLDAEVPLMDLLLAGAMAARIADGTNLVAVDLTGSSVANTLQAVGLQLQLRLIEAPQFAHGRARWIPADDVDNDGLIEPGEQARYETHAETAQVEVSLDLEMEKSVLGGLLDTVESITTSLLETLGLGNVTCWLLGIGCPSGTATLHLALSAAQADANLTSIDCQQPAETSDVTGTVSSQAVDVQADLLGSSLLDVQAGGGVDEEVVFDEVPDSASTSGGSALGGVELLTVLGLDGVLDPVLGLLGIELGTGHMGLHAIRCDIPVLLPNP